MAKTKGHTLSLGYFFPFGSTSQNNIEFLNGKVLTDENNRNTNSYLMNSNPTEDNPNHTKPMFIFCYDQEPLIHSYVKEVFDSVEKNVKMKSIVGFTTSNYVFMEHYGSPVYVSNLYKAVKYKKENKKIAIILLNTEKDSVEKNKLLQEYNFIDCYYFFHALAAADWYRGYYYCLDITPIKQRKLKKKFITFNRITGNARVYRSFLIAKLIQKNLINEGYVSYSKNCPVHGDLKLNLIESKKNYNVPSLYINDCLNVLKNLKDELRIDTPKNNPIDNKSFTIGPIQESIESFVHIVTETCFWEQKLHLTEKIFKPIVLKQPFVLVGCAKNLAYLKSYGFKTFDRWWDESYDDCQDPLQRLDMIANLVEKICSYSHKELESMLLEMEEVLEYNFNRFYSKEFIAEVWGELVTNLDQAISQLEPRT